MLFRNFYTGLAASEVAASLAGLSTMQSRQCLLAYHLALPQYKYAGGHVYGPPALVERFADDWSFVTILRDPIDRWISEYVYNRFKISNWAKNDLPIEEFLNTEVAQRAGQTYLRYFSSFGWASHAPTAEHIEEAVANLARFTVVGTVDNFDGWIASFREEFGVSLKITTTNVSPNKAEADRIKKQPELMREIHRLCEDDMAVYQRIINTLPGRSGPHHAPRVNVGRAPSHSGRG